MPRSYSIEHGYGLIQASEYGVVIKPPFWRANKTAPIALYCPALAGGGENITGWGPAFELAKRGYVVLASDLGDTPSVPYGTGLPAALGGTGNGGNGVWGNDAAMTKLTAVYNYALNTLKGRTGKVALMGGSHGGSTACRWAAQNPTLVSCVLLGIGCVDHQDILTNNRSGFAASIQQAWGLGAGTTLPAGATGIQNAPNIQCPVLSYYSDNDPITPIDRQQAFQAANPTNITIKSFGAVGHATTGFPSAVAAAWIASHS